MSGGFYNYVCYKVREAADYTQDKEIRALINDLADLLHDEEWYMSGDTGREDYRKSLKEFKKKWLHQTDNKKLKKYIMEALDQAKEEIDNMV